MKATLFQQHGGPEVLEYTDFPTPEPKPGQALVKLHVAALSEDALRVQVDGTTRLRIHANGNVGVGANITPSFQFEVAGAGTAGKPGGGSWSNSSDRRLKKNIEDLDGSLDKLMRLRGVSFEYLDPDAINELPGQRLGMVAQEVEEVFPDWVSPGGHGYKTLTFRGFEALAVEALRELREEKDEQIATLRTEKDAQITALQAQNANLHEIIAFPQ